MTALGELKIEVQIGPPNRWRIEGSREALQALVMNVQVARKLGVANPMPGNNESELLVVCTDGPREDEPVPEPDP